MSTNKSVSEGTASYQKKRQKNQIQLFNLSYLNPPTSFKSHTLQKKIVFNKGGRGGELTPWSRGSIAVEHLNAMPGSGETPVRMN